MADGTHQTESWRELPVRVSGHVTAAGSRQDADVRLNRLLLAHLAATVLPLPAQEVHTHSTRVASVFGCQLERRRGRLPS